MKRTLYTLAAVSVAACALFLCAAPTSGYISIRIPVGNFGQALPTRWDLANAAGRPNIANRRVLYQIDDAGCADRAGFIGPINEFEAIQNSFSQWRNITESEIDFEFTGATTSANSNASDNRNVLHWVGGNISSGVFAVTITTFTTATGDITDVDMELNDRDFTWDTVGPTAATGHIGRAIIENVVTHEVGHFIGLDHPSNSRSTLFFQSGPGLIGSISLEADDRAPVIADYPNPDFTDARLGTVSGTVDNGTSPQFGVEVLLLDLATGRNVIGSITEGTPGPFALGSFEVQNVPPGNYVVLCWPTNRAALGSYYASAFINFFPVIRGVAVGTAAVPTLAKVGPGGAVTGVNVTLPVLPQTPFEPNGTSATAKDIASGQAAVANISPGNEEDWFKFTTTSANQQVRVRVMADVLGSSLNPTLTMYAPNGTTVLVSPNFGDPAFMASANDLDSAAFDVTGPNFDAEIARTMATPGVYFFKVTSRLGATNGAYVVFFEIDGTDTAVDANLSAISTSVAGVATGGAGFTVTVVPRNMLGRDLTGTFTVELLDATLPAPVVLDTLTGIAPFVFNRAALALPQVVKYGARVAGNVISETVSVSHFGAVSTATSRVLALEKTISGNGYDIVPVRVELRDAANNPFRDPAAVVLVSTTLGTLNNGTANGASVIAATYDATLGLWRINLVAPTTVGTASVTATVGGNAIALGANILVLQRASGTGISPGDGDGEDDQDEDSGSCVSQSRSMPGLVLGVAILATLGITRRRKSRV